MPFVPFKKKSGGPPHTATMPKHGKAAASVDDEAEASSNCVSHADGKPQVGVHKKTAKFEDKRKKGKVPPQFMKK